MSDVALSRRRWLHRVAVLAGGAGLSAGGAVRAATEPAASGAANTVGSPQALPLATSLRDEMAQALVRQQPLVVMVSLPGCPFCHVARQSFLQPMRASGQISVVQVDMRSQRALIDATGQATTHDQWVRARGIKIAPTLLFLGPDGQELTERLVGAMIPDFYGAYLDQRLQAASAKLPRR